MKIFLIMSVALALSTPNSTFCLAQQPRLTGDFIDREPPPVSAEARRELARIKAEKAAKKILEAAQAEAERKARERTRNGC